MAIWFQVATRYQKEDEAGALKTHNELHLYDAVSHTEAEAKANANLISGAGEFSVVRITKLPLADLFEYEDGEKWFKGKIVYFSVDEKTGKEKRVVNAMLVNADGIDQALQRFTESLRTMLLPYETEAISLTQILDVYPHEETV